MASLSSSLIVRLVDQVTAPAKQMSASIRGIGSAFAALSGKGLTARLDEAIQRNNKALAAMRGRMLDAAAVGYTLSRAFAAPVRAAMDFESSMADVRKVVDFDTPAEFKQFQQDVIDMSRRIPMAAQELSQIVANAGQSGIAKSDLLQFTEMAAKVGVAFDISADQAGEALAKMKTGLGLTIAETAALADSMNHLSDSQASSASDVLDVVRRVGATAKQYGFRPEQVAAFGSAMVSAGAETEVAATSFRNMGRALTLGEAATKRQRTAYKALGLDARKVAQNMQKDAVGTTLDVMERLNRMPKHQQAALSSMLFGDEARALGPLLTNLDLLRTSLGLVAKQENYLGSAEREYINRSKTFANNLQLFRNRLNALGVNIGNTLLPALTALLDRIGPIVDAIARFAEAHPELVRNIVLATTALIGFRVAAFAARFAALYAKGGVLQLASSLLGIGRFGGRLGKVLAAPFAAFGRTLGRTRRDMALVNALATTGLFSRRQVIAGNIGAISRNMLALLNPLRLAGAAFRAVGLALRFAFIGTGIGAIVAGIAAGGTWIYNNWSGLSAMFGSFAETLQQRFPGAAAAVGRVVDRVAALWRWISDLLGPLDATGNTWKGWGKSAANAVADVVDWIASVPGRISATAAEWATAFTDLARQGWEALKNYDWLGLGAAIVQAIIDGISSMAGAFANKLSQMAGDAAAKVKGFFSFGGGAAAPGAGAPAQGQTAGGFARGGHFSGGPMIVGEQGPELITASSSGHVHTAAETRRMFAGAGGKAGAQPGRAMSLTWSGNVVINGNASQEDAETIAQRVLDKLSDLAWTGQQALAADIG